MKRRELIQKSAFGLMVAAVPVRARTPPAPASEQAPMATPLTPPAEGPIPVAFLISDGAVMIDFAGPWEVFQDVMLPGRGHGAFRLYTVAETARPIRASGGMQIIPDFTLASAPAPRVIVIPAQSDPSEAVLEWIRKSNQTADVTMSVCTGAFLLARTGLLSGKTATTHHGAYQELAMDFPDIRVKRGARFVESGNLATAGGLSSGIDLALHVVERYFGREAARRTADTMEYQGLGWTNADSNQEYLEAKVSTDAHPLCPVCFMDVDKASAAKSVYKGRTYWFCMDAHKQRFDSAPERFVEAKR